MDTLNNPPIESITPNLPVEKKQSPVLIIILCIVLIFTVLFLYLLFFTDKLQSLKILDVENQNSQQTEDQGDENDNTSPQLTTYEGSTFTAQLPESWSIEEYENGNGTTMLPDGSFTGLTGMKIFKDGTEMFYLQAIYGIGFSGCPNYARFTDESTEYFNEIINDNEISSGIELNITDYTEQEYTEFEWLGKTFRRVNTVYNYDTIDGNEYFEPPCVPSLVTFDGLEFQPEDGPPATAYDYGLTENATEQDLEIIDSILESMTLSN